MSTTAPTAIPSPTTAHAAVGMRVQDLDTPALLLDIAAVDRNLKRMAAFFAGKPCRLRPHFKNHKCTRLAQLQLEAGSAVGLTCAKLGEAEVLARHGFDNLLVANQVVGAAKVRRLIDVARQCRVAVAVDAVEQAVAISEAASATGVSVGVMIEVDIGMGRCGVHPGEPALELAQQIVLLPGLRLDGLQAFEGHIIYINDFEQRAQLARQSMQKAIDTRELLEDHGIKINAISGGATATYSVVGLMDGMDEVQAGSYPTMDWRYHEVVPEFEVALTVLARVISRRSGAAVIDVGVKGAGAEFGIPRIKGHPQVEIPFFLAEEHCVIKSAPPPPAWRVGDAVELLPSHACTTCNLHRHFYVHEAGRVVDVWPIEASGMLS